MVFFVALLVRLVEVLMLLKEKATPVGDGKSLTEGGIEICPSIRSGSRQQCGFAFLVDTILSKRRTKTF